MPRYKRTYDAAFESALDPDVPPSNMDTLKTLRNIPEFASLMQFLYIFGTAVKAVDDQFDIDVSLPRQPK